MMFHDHDAANHSDMAAIDTTTAPKLLMILPSKFWKVALVSTENVSGGSRAPDAGARA